MPLTMSVRNGDIKLDDGGVMSILKESDAEVVFPALSLDCMSMICSPSIEIVVLVPSCHSPLSIRYFVDAIPDVSSESKAVTATGETNHSFKPLVPLINTSRAGFSVSTKMVFVREPVFPALSMTVTTIVCVPSFTGEEGNACPPPSTERETLERPERLSEPMAVKSTGEIYQSFIPSVPMISRFGIGSWGSYFQFELPIALFPDCVAVTV